MNISAQVLLDRERCVLCARCTRFSKQIAGDPFIDMFERGALQQVSIYENAPFESYFSGNTIQICPVGALTSAAYRFRSRPFDLVSTPSVCEHCSGGCAQRTDHRRGKVMRRLAGEDPEVNEEWNCDKGRFAFTYATRQDRLTGPLVRESDGTLVPASWREALGIVAEKLGAARGAAGVLPGGRLTLEDNYAYAKFARVALDTNDIDFRARPHSGEEADFLAAYVAGYGVFAGSPSVTYRAIEAAPVVLLAGLEAEEEAASVFLRLRKANLKSGLRVFSLAAYQSNGLFKTGGTLLPTVPGTEAAMLDRIGGGEFGPQGTSLAELLVKPGAVILAGERLATSPGALAAVVRLATATGALLAWLPRRSGERGAVEAGALPNLLPGGRLVTDAAARGEIAAAWGLEALPAEPGRDLTAMLSAATSGQIKALVVGGVDVDDLPDPRAALTAFNVVDFLVSLEVRASEVSERADVVFPVPVVAEKAGTFLNWEGRMRPFPQALRGAAPMTDLRVLDAIADEMDRPLGLRDTAAAAAELASLGRWTGTVAAPAAPAPAAAKTPGPGEAVLATWHMLLDLGRLQDGEPHLARTARRPVVRLSPATAAEIGAGEGGLVGVSSDLGTIRLPLVVTEMPDRVVWLPTKSPGSTVLRDLGVDAGGLVRIRVGGSL